MHVHMQSASGNIGLVLLSSSVMQFTLISTSHTIPILASGAFYTIPIFFIFNFFYLLVKEFIEGNEQNF